MSKIIYSPESEVRRPARLARSMLVDLKSSHGLALRLAIRDLSAQHRQAILGFLWVILLPLANTAAWLFLKNAGIVDIDGTSIPYALYVVTGSMLWSIFTDALNAPLQQTLAAKSMLVKINFPKEALVVAGLYQTLFNAVLKLAFVFVAFVVYGQSTSWSLLALPVAVFSLVLIGTALGLLLTPIGVLYSDMGRALPLLTQFLIFVTPVAYPVVKTGWAGIVMQNNPLTPVMEFARDCLLGTHQASLSHFLLVNVAVLVLLLGVWVVYRMAMPILIERMG